MKRYLFLLIFLLLGCAQKDDVRIPSQITAPQVELLKGQQKIVLSDAWERDSLIIKEFMRKYEITPIYEVEKDRVKLQIRINKLKELTSANEVKANPVLKFWLNVSIANSLLELSSLGDSSGVYEAEERLVESLKVIPPEFKKDIFWVNMFLGHIYVYTGRLDKSFETFSNLIEGEGDKRLKIQAVRALYGAVLEFCKGDVNRPEILKVANYFLNLKSKYDDEIGFMAGVNLCDYYTRRNEIDKSKEIVEELKSKIDRFSKYPELDNYLKICQLKLQKAQ